MKRYTKTILPFFLLCMIPFLVCGCRSREEANFDSFLNRSLKTLAEEDAFITHSFFGNPSSYSIKEDGNATFRSFDPDTMASVTGNKKDMLSRLKGFDTSRLSLRQQQISLLMKDRLETAVEMGMKYPLHATTLGESGTAVSLIYSLSEYTFRSKEDIDRYLVLLEDVPDYLKELYAYEKNRNKEGIPSSSLLIRDTSEAIQTFVNTAPEKNVLSLSFTERLEKLSTLSEEEITDYTNKNQDLITKNILPAYLELADNITSNLTVSDEMDSVCSYPSGASYYKLLLKSNVGTALSPEECKTALEEMYQKAGEDMTELYKNRKGLDSDNLSAFPAETDPGQILAQLRRDTLVWFPKISSVNCTVDELPEALSGPHNAAYYEIPPLDSDTDNRILVNALLTGPDQLFHTLAHEGYPGHLYQTNYFYENLYHPIQLFLRTGGYDEGWATYGELFSYDFLEFSNKDEDVTDRLRSLRKDQALIRLSLYALSDLYVNYENHTLEDLVLWMNDRGVDPDEAETLYHYVISHPTEYLKYAIGYYELDRLAASREEKVSLQNFHESLLRYGSCPFYLLSTFIGYARR